MMEWNDLEDVLNLETWSEEQRLQTPTFTAQFTSDGTLLLRGVALEQGFSGEDVEKLTRFLAEHVHLPPNAPLYDFKDVVFPLIDA